MLILNKTFVRLHLQNFYRCSIHTVTQSVPINKQNSDTVTTKRKKNLIVNFKYGPAPSDPLYENLIYSTEAEVYLTAKKGKAWLEMQAAKKYQAENERRERERAALAKPVPLALQYLYDGSQRVQKEEDVINNEVIEGREEVAGELEAGQESIPPVFPYGVYDSIENDTIEDKNPDMNDDPNLNRSGRRRRKRPVNEEAKIEENNVNNVDYDTIDDSGHSQDIRQLFTEDHLFKFGTADPGYHGAKTDIPCGGCGAHLHCVDEKVPGFVPSQILANRSYRELRSILCQRCYFIKEYKIALKLNVSPEDYPKAIEHIKDKKALIILVVDLLDFPGSVWPGILELMGKNKKVILVGNKFDLIVPDSKRYYKNITNVLRSEFLKKCWSEASADSAFPQIIGTLCLSATTGYNVEKLVEMIFNNWKNHNDAMPGDIYIVGCTNVGKSSLFNMLLDSDLCKVSAINLVEKAMISPVPGTTLNLLKFPVTRPEPHFLANRRSRLTNANNLFKKMEIDRLKLLSSSKDVMLSVPSHYTIKHTLLSKIRDGKDDIKDNKLYSNTLDVENVPGVNAPARLDPDERQWGKHCHDSPGTVSEDQIINLLTAEEISRVLTTKPIQPRTFLLKQGQTLLLGGLARLDVISCPKELHPVRITVFCSRDLPLNIINTTGVAAFLEVAQGRNFLKVPENHRPEIPKMAGVELTVTGAVGSGRGLVDGGSWKGAADVVLSSCGWVMVSPKEDEEVTLAAYTIGGKGIALREPFLANAINYRGKRIAGTPAFRNDLVYQPLNSY